MKNPRHILAATLFATLAVLPSCDHKAKHDADARIRELERKASAADAHNARLVHELELQKLANERDAIEREKLALAEERDSLEQARQDERSTAADALREREEELSHKADELARMQVRLDESVDQVGSLSDRLSDLESEVAGRDALPAQAIDAPDTTIVNTPVADYHIFYSSLSNYGSWFSTPDYGYVWQPAAHRTPGWRPYTHGRWACTDAGWAWISDEPFGWATYHYGRWALARDIGWIWVPGSEWAPSWVTWRYGGNHIGWAPLPPETLAYRRHHWDSGVEASFRIGGAWFTFVETRHFGGRIAPHCLRSETYPRIMASTRNITNITFANNRVISGGPSLRELNRVVPKPIPFYRIDHHRDRWRGNDSLAMLPTIANGRIAFSAPNIDSAWNSSLRPKKVSRDLSRIEIERPGPIQRELADRYRSSRLESLKKAEETVRSLGGREAFENTRRLELEKNRARVIKRENRRPRHDERQARQEPNPPPSRVAEPQPPVRGLPANPGPEERFEARRRQQAEEQRPSQAEQQRQQAEEHRHQQVAEQRERMEAQRQQAEQQRRQQMAEERERMEDQRQQAEEQRRQQIAEQRERMEAQRQQAEQQRQQAEQQRQQQAEQQRQHLEERRKEIQERLNNRPR